MFVMHALNGTQIKFLYGELGVLACNPLHFPFRRHQPGTSAAAGATASK